MVDTESRATAFEARYEAGYNAGFKAGFKSGLFTERQDQADKRRAAETNVEEKSEK